MTELCEQLIDGLLCLCYRLFLSPCQGFQRRPGQKWQVCACRVNTCTPTRPLPLRRNLISAIVVPFRFRHLSCLAQNDRSPRLAEIYSQARDRP
jgi:hypothetical protein